MKRYTSMKRIQKHSQLSIYKDPALTKSNRNRFVSHIKTQHFEELPLLAPTYFSRCVTASSDDYTFSIVTSYCFQVEVIKLIKYSFTHIRLTTITFLFL
jgi:hypothetical protein